MKKFKPLKKIPIYDKVVISVRLSEEMLKAIDRFAGVADVSRNEFINQCIEFALNSMDSKGVSEKKANKVMNEVS